MTDDENPIPMTEAEAQARRRRSRWMALALVGFVLLIFAITISRLGAAVLVREL